MNVAIVLFLDQSIFNGRYCCFMLFLPPHVERKITIEKTLEVVFLNVKDFYIKRYWFEYSTGTN